jgi:type I pantothenate kinase
MSQRQIFSSSQQLLEDAVLCCTSLYSLNSIFSLFSISILPQNIIMLKEEKNHLESIKTIILDHYQQSSSPLIVGICGAVSVGKSTFAQNLQRLFNESNLTITIIGGDSFLMSNKELLERGWMDKKGFPETYKEDLIIKFLQDLKQIRQCSVPLSIPIYDHATYDIISEEMQTVSPANIYLFEGINVLRFQEHLNIKLFLEASAEDLHQWYMQRWLAFKSEIDLHPSEFFQSFVQMTKEEFAVMLNDVWNTINWPNYLQHIAPLKETADWVIWKANNHEIVDVLKQEH